jgi:SpoIID/LytB domain protein
MAMANIARRACRVAVAGVLACAVSGPVHKTAAQQALAPAARGPAFRLIELPSGRVLAEARPDLLATPVAPGSLMKLVTLVAAVEHGVVDEHTRITCRRTVVVDGKTLTCVHPDLHRPLTAAEAIGYSCNGFFAAVAQRVTRESLDGVLIRMGLPAIAAGAPVASAALGLAGMKATPGQLLEAFLRAVGPWRHEIAMPDAARRILRSGTELAVSAGTASALGAAGFTGLAKTGTAPMPGGGFAGIVTAEVNAELPTHAIVVLVPGGAGADAAAEAARLLAGHGAPRRVQQVRVGVARRDGSGYDVVVEALDDYVAEVVAGEMGPDAPPAALEAMAITARTFVAANMGRHEAEGFDVCDLTHCQVRGRSSRSTAAAARATSGLILVDGGRPAQVYFSAWCGGYTDTPSRAWRGAQDRPYLPAQPDPACADERAWTTELPEPELRRALEAAGLKGSSVTAFSVSSRSPSGRVDELRAAGMTPDRIGGNAFRAAAGRVLGWQSVKSTLFEVGQSATGYVLTGRGSGHGVGLCIRGAANRGRAGASRTDILAAYFPGLAVESRQTAAWSARPLARVNTLIRVSLPEGEREQVRGVQMLAGRALKDMAARLAVAPPPEVALEFHPTVEAFSRATGQPWWTAARTTGTRIDLLPRAVLARRGILETTLRHEFVHLLAEPALAGRALWVREGLAVALAGELPRDGAKTGERTAAGAPVCPSDEDLRTAPDRESWRRAYDAAGRCAARALADGRRWKDLR